MNRPVSILLFLLLSGAGSSVPAQQVNNPADIPIEAFAQLPVMNDAQLSPDGTYLAYISPIKGRGYLIIQNLVENNTPIAVPPAEKMDFEWLHWANNERLLFTVSAMGVRGVIETPETRLWATDADGSNAQSIVLPSRKRKTGSSLGRALGPAQLQGNIIHWLPDEPNHILLSIDGDHDGAAEVRRIDIRDGEFEVIRRDTDGIQNWLADQSGTVRFGWGYRNTIFRMLIRNSAGEWQPATDARWRDDGFFPQGFTESADIMYMHGPDENGYEVVRTMNIETGEFLESVFAQDGIDAGGLIHDPITQYPVGVNFVDDQHQVRYFDESLHALQRSIDKVQPNTVNRIISTTSDRRKVLVHSSSDIDAGAYLFLDRDEKSLSYISAAMPGLPSEMMSPIDSVSYLARDGLKIPGYLTVPKGQARENLAVVVMPHGGPASRDDKSFWFLSQFLASRGYAIFQPNFRGSSGYGRSFELAGKKEWGGKMQEDVTDGVQWLIDEGIADPKRICIVGWSYGGYSAAMGAVQTPDLYQCAASINGVLDLPLMIADDKKYIGGSAWTRHVGLEDAKTKAVSPYHQAERISVPMLIVQAEDDPRVHENQGKRMVRRLKKLRKPVEFVEVELGGHGMTNEMARQQILRSLEIFLAENLGTDGQTSERLASQ